MSKAWNALKEAERCLGCYDAPCIAGCPAGIDIPKFIGRIRTGNITGAYNTLVQPNPLPAVCSLVCPTEELCEARCVLTKLDDRPVAIAALQHYVCQQAQADENASEKQGDPLAVIGGGPAGIACAIGLRRKGYEVHVYDEHELLGGLLSYAIPNYRLTDQAVISELDRLKKSGLEFHLNERIDEERLQTLISGHRAVFLGIGLSAGKHLSVQGTSFQGVWPALDFLAAARRAKRGEGAHPGLIGHVVVIGGGNVALDSACIAAVGGASKVTVIYRRLQEDMPAWKSEYQHACSLGVEFCWLTDLSEVTGTDDRVNGVRVHRTRRLVEKDSSGRYRVEPIPDSEEILACDAVMLAIGQTMNFDGLEQVGIKISRNGTIMVDPLSYQTSRAGVFAGGDVIRGGATVVQAVADGMKAAQTIHSYLVGEEVV